MTARTVLVQYKKLLYQFMSYLDGVDYSPRDDTTDETLAFTTERLASITADDVACYLKFKAYGTEHPAEDERSPPLCRSNTPIFHKMAISYFMSSGMQWDEFGRIGNPTKSAAVRNVISKVRKYEIHHDRIRRH